MFKRQSIFVFTLAVLTLIDMYAVCTRYVNSDNFTEPVANEEAFKMSDVDRAILKDTVMNYRVMDVTDMGGARSSYFHKTIGGYHAAKLTRYNDLLDHQISKGNMGVLNMLNTKYFISADEQGTLTYDVNPYTNGNAWFVSGLDYVADANHEMAALDSLDTRTAPLPTLSSSQS